MKLATIERIKDVYPHPNADSLEFVKVLGYQCIVPKGKWNVGDWCILIQPDTVLPDADWANVYKKHSAERVRALKLRGSWSYGIVEDLKILSDDRYFIELAFLEEGVEVSADLGITKYEEPEPVDPNIEKGYPSWLRKTGEDLFQNLNLQGWYGQLVDVTLKIDGKSLTNYLYNDEFRICSRRAVFRPTIDNEFVRLAKKYDIETKLRKFRREFGIDISLRGEIAGRGISKGSRNPYLTKEPDYYLFGVYANHSYENFGPDSEFYFEKIAPWFEIPTVPILEKQVPLTRELLDRYQTIETLPSGEMFEGVVIVGNGFSFKVINLNYDSKK